MVSMMIIIEDQGVSSPLPEGDVLPPGDVQGDGPVADVLEHGDGLDRAVRQDKETGRLAAWPE